MDNLDILCLGELNIDEIANADHITDDQNSVKLRSVGKYYGGRGGNVSVYASMFGVKTGIIAALGQDQEGNDYKNHLISNNVNVENLFESKKAHTSKCFIFNESDKTRIFYYGGANVEEYNPYLQHIKECAKKLETEAIFCTSPTAEVNSQCLSLSKAKIKAFAPSSNIKDYTKDIFEACLQNTDILFLNENETRIAESLLGKNITSSLKNFNIKIFIQTLGKEGSEVNVNGNTKTIPPYTPKRVLDTTGAGDSYAGAFMANYIKTNDAIYSAKIGSATASFVVENFGSQAVIPKKEEITERMEHEN